MSDNRTNEPTEAQVEAAVNAAWERQEFHRGPGGQVVEAPGPVFRHIIESALVAAQGAAPQAESEHEYLLKARELHQTNSGLPSSTVDEWVYRARISILNSGSHTSPEAARAAIDRMIEDHVLELEPEPVFIEKRLRNAWVPVVEAIGGESR